MLAKERAEAFGFDLIYFRTGGECNEGRATLASRSLNNMRILKGNAIQG